MNVIIGNHVPVIFPPTSFAQKDNHAPVPTNQLHSTPENTPYQNVVLTFDSAVVNIFANVAPSVSPVT